MLTDEDCGDVLAGIADDVIGTGDVAVIAAYDNIMAEEGSDIERLARFLVFMQTHVKQSSQHLVEQSMLRLNELKHVGSNIDSALVAFPSGRDAGAPKRAMNQ